MEYSDQLIARLKAELHSTDERERRAKNLVKELGRSSVAVLRQRYFPLWRPGTRLQPNRELRQFRGLVVEDQEERAIVEAVAPEGIEYEVTVQPDPTDPWGALTGWLDDEPVDDIDEAIYGPE
jgi:hypothetical protein